MFLYSPDDRTLCRTEFAFVPEMGLADQEASLAVLTDI